MTRKKEERIQRKVDINIQVQQLVLISFGKSDEIEASPNLACTTSILNYKPQGKYIFFSMQVVKMLKGGSVLTFFRRKRLITGE